MLHLQCHFGADTLSLAQRGATVVGLDFSGAAIAAARDLAARARPCRPRALREADLYDAPAAIAEPASFDLVYTSWGVTCWLPDIRRWAEIVAQFLKPGGRFYYADAHPAAYVFDDDARLADGRPGYFAPYFGRQPLVLVEHKDYADPTAHLANATNVEWLHPLSDIVGGLIDAGLVARLAARARPGAVAHVRDAGAEGRRRLALAGQAVAAARRLAAGAPAGLAARRSSAAQRDLLAQPQEGNGQRQPAQPARGLEQVFAGVVGRR